MKWIIFAVLLCTTKISSATEMVRNKATAVVAHRGAWKEFNLPENSIAALQQAINIGCQGIELDIHLTADDSIVVFHDNTIQGKYLTETPFSTLQQHLLSNGETIPTLAQFLNAYTAHKGPILFVELKHSNLDAARKAIFVAKVLEHIQQTQLDSFTTYISFDWDICALIKQAAPFAKVQFLNAKQNHLDPSQIKAAGFDGIDYQYKQLQIHPNWLPQAQKMGLECNTWTVNDPKDWAYFIDASIDFITTDYPSALLQFIQQPEAQ